MVRRDTLEKKEVDLSKLDEEIEKVLEDIQSNMFKLCEKRLEEKTTTAITLEEFTKKMEEEQRYIKAMWCGDGACEDKIKELTGAHSRCIPFKQEIIR